MVFVGPTALALCALSALVDAGAYNLWNSSNALYIMTNGDPTAITQTTGQSQTFAAANPEWNVFYSLTDGQRYTFGGQTLTRC